MANCSKMAKLSSAAFEDLPDEVVLQIFKHLEFYDNASSSQVCKRWKLLSKDQSLWQKINLHGREVPAKFIEKALRHGCQYLGLKGIKIENVVDPNSFSIKNQLKYLTISCDEEHEHHGIVLKNLLGATQLLEKLSIECDRECGFYFEPNIIQNNKTLKVLRISEHKYLSFETVKSIFTNCLELSEVSLEDCGMPVEALSFLCNNLTNKIKKLSLFRIRAFDSEDYILEEEHVIAIANCCPQLEELDLGGQENFISEVALSTIIEKLPNLIKLKLPDTGQIPFPKLLQLGSLPNLKDLRVHVDYSNMSRKEVLRNFVPKSNSEVGSVSDKYDKWDRKTPLIRELVKNLPNLKINKGSFDIADPDSRFLCRKSAKVLGLWEIPCKPTRDFNDIW